MTLSNVRLPKPQANQLAYHTVLYLLFCECINPKNKKRLRIEEIPLDFWQSLDSYEQVSVLASWIAVSKRSR